MVSLKMEVPAMDDIVVVFSFVGMKTQEIIYKGEAVCRLS